MKTIFQLNEEKNMLTARQMCSKDDVNYATRCFLKNCFQLEGFDYENTKIVSCWFQEFEDSIEFEGREAFLYKYQGQEYLGKSTSSNVGVASNGCDHYYEDQYTYKYSKTPLPKDILATFNCMRDSVYYDSSMTEILRYPYYYNTKGILDLERKSLENAKESFKELKSYIDSGDVYRSNLQVIWGILRRLYGQKDASYPISTSNDLLHVLRKYEHGATKVLSSYIESDDRFNNLEILFKSLQEEAKDSKDKANKSILNQIIQIFELTPDWLEFFAEVREVNEEKIRRLIIR